MRLLQERSDILCGEVNEAIVGWARLDVAIPAGDVAECARVDPQGLQTLERYRRAWLAAGGPIRILELLARERVLKGGGQRHGGMILLLSLTLEWG